MPRLIWLILLILAFAPWAEAQVATPSLDPTFPARSPAASSWRFGSTVGGTSTYGAEETTEEKVDNRFLRSGGIVAWQPTLSTIELYQESEAHESKYTTEGLEEIVTSGGQAHLSIRGHAQVSVGLGYRMKNWQYNQVSANRVYYGGAFGVRMGDGFYIGGGMERVREQIDGANDKIWNETMAGIALNYGDPTGSMFRMEGSVINSPEVIEGDEWYQQKEKTNETVGAVEVLLGGLLLGFQNNRTVTYPIGGGTESIYSANRYGLGLRVFGLSFGAYRIFGEMLQGDEEDAYKDNYYLFNVSFNFI